MANLGTPGISLMLNSERVITFSYLQNRKEKITNFIGPLTCLCTTCRFRYSHQNILFCIQVFYYIQIIPIHSFLDILFIYLLDNPLSLP